MAPHSALARSIAHADTVDGSAGRRSVNAHLLFLVSRRRLLSKAFAVVLMLLCMDATRLLGCSTEQILDLIMVLPNLQDT